MLADLRYAFRSLASRPLVTAVAVLSLALGIGVNASVFSAVERLVLRRLPIAEPTRIVLVTSPGPRPGSRSTGDSGRVDAVFSYPLFRDMERLDPGALTMAAHRDFGANLAWRGQTSNGEGLLVSGQYFQALGLTPALGRLLGPEDDRVAGGHPVVVLSHDYWATRFGADPRVLDDTLVVNGSALTIVGVAPAGFSGTTSLDRPQVFVPIAMAQIAFGSPSKLTERRDHWVYVFARLQPGTSLEQAQGRINVPFANLMRDVELPAARSGLGDRDRDAFARRPIQLKDGSHLRDASGDEARIILVFLFAITGFVLTIACANVANLLLSRVVDRSGEIAVRVSLGASSLRLVRLLLVEAFVLALLGSTGALVVSRLAIAGILAMLPVEDRAMLAFSINVPVLLFTGALGLATTVFFGLFPAVHLARHAAAAGLQAHSVKLLSGSRSATRFRTSMATLQVALATALLAIAGLFLASLSNVTRSDIGIEREGLVTFRVSPSLNGYTTERAGALFDAIEEGLRALPGVTAVSESTVPILADSNWTNNVTVEGFDARPDADARTSVARIGVSYFATLGIPFLAGRDFTLADRDDAPQVAVVNEAFTRKFNLSTRAVGARMAMGAGENKPLDIRIVGVVRDSKYSEVRAPAPPQLFLPYRQGGAGNVTFYVRSGAAPGGARTDALLGAIPSIMQRLDPNLPITHLRTMDDQIWNNTARDRFLSTLSSWFAILATVLAIVGLYAVLAYGVSQRLREIGIRIAIGAQASDVRWLMVSQIARVCIAGGTIGAMLALGLGRLGGAMLVGVNSSSPTIIGAALLIAIAGAAAAGIVPVRRATRVDPVVTLK